MFLPTTVSADPEALAGFERRMREPDASVRAAGIALAHALDDLADASGPAGLDHLASRVLAIAAASEQLAAWTASVGRAFAGAGATAAASLAANIGIVPRTANQGAIAANHARVESAIRVAYLHGDWRRVAELTPLLSMQVLEFDPVHDRVAVVVGDLDRASHVAIIVPGMDTTIGDIGARVADAARLQALADRDDGPGETTAVIAWIGYETPDLAHVASAHDASAGATALGAFWRDLATRAGASITVIGHSYGTLVVADALRSHLITPNAVVFLGSPGVSVESVRDLDAPATDVYAERAAFDPVAYTEWFGPDPADPSFGAVRLSTDGDSDLVVGHSSYFAAGSTSLGNLAAVTAGRGRLTLQHPTVAEAAAGLVERAAEITAALGPVAAALPPVGAAASLVERGAEVEEDADDVARHVVAAVLGI